MELKEFVNGYGQTALARKLGVTQGLVFQWVTGRTQVSAKYCMLIEKLTKGQVMAEEMRPDLPWSIVRKKRRKQRPQETVDG